MEDGLHPTSGVDASRVRDTGKIEYGEALCEGATAFPGDLERCRPRRSLLPSGAVADVATHTPRPLARCASAHPLDTSPTKGRPDEFAAAANVALEAVFADLATLFVEGLVLGRIFGGLLWPAMTHVMAPRLAVLERGFDRDFYLRQFDDEAQRRRVARAPLLHYAMLGWRTRRAPAPGFDPAFYRRRNLQRPPRMDPLSHHLEKPHSQSSPRNEVEARTDRPPWREGVEAVLVFHHGRGGGSSRFLDLYEGDVEDTGRNVLRARTVLSAANLAVIGDRVFDLSSGLDLLADFARHRRVTRLVVNHLIDRPLEMTAWVRDLGKRMGVPYDVILHDYFMLCPRIDLVTGQGVFCDVAPPETCVRCVVEHGAEVREFDPLSWRRDHLTFLEGADRIVAPSDDVAGRMRRYVNKPVVVWEPESDADLPPEHAPRVREAEPCASPHWAP